MLIGIMLLLSGCVRKYGRSEIASYVRRQTGRSSMIVSEGYREIQEDEEGYLDHLWTVTDSDSGTVFHVLDDYYWTMEKVQNRLLHDYDACVFLSLLDQEKIPRPEQLSLKKTQESGLVSVIISCTFKDTESLRACYEALRTLREGLEEAGYPGLEVPYTVKYQNPLRGRVDYEVDEGDTQGSIGDVDEEEYARMREKYLCCALDYRFEDALREFDDSEINALVHSPGTVRILNEGEAYEDVIGSPKYEGISFGTFFEILRREGFRPSGNAWHFTWVAKDGSKMEFSYDFCDLSGFNDARGKLKSGYYYIRDDKKIRMKAYYKNHLEAPEINALTGLRLTESRAD
ncbi:MAG: hypothetical protein Q4D81_07270 [Eubacteriales bacterium]|nr:hypothetical protein [Eubacteriales bacterium]